MLSTTQFSRGTDPFCWCLAGMLNVHTSNIRWHLLITLFSIDVSCCMCGSGFSVSSENFISHKQSHVDPCLQLPPRAVSLSRHVTDSQPNSPPDPHSDGMVVALLPSH